MTTTSTPPAVRGLRAPHERLLQCMARVQPDERRCLLLFFSHAFLLLVAYYVLKTLREPLLLDDGSAALKSYAQATVALVLIPLVPLYGVLVRRGGGKRSGASWVTLLCLANLAAFYVLGRAGVDIGFAYYVWVGIFGVTLIAQFWAQAAEAFSVECGERLFPVIMVGATLGALAGPLLVRLLYTPNDPESLLLLAGVLLAASVPLIRAARVSVPLGSRSIAAAAERRVAHPFGGFALLARDPYLALVAALVVLLNCVNTTGEYILADLVSTHVDGQIALDPSLAKGALIARFYADFHFAVNAVTLVMQVFLVARVFRSVGVQGALLVVPVIALLGYALVAFLPIFAVLSVMKVIENAGDYSVSNTARQALFLPLPSAAKSEGKIAIDTFFWRFGDLLQGALIFVGLSWFGFETRDFAVLNLVLAAVWLAVAARLAKRYAARTAAPVRPPKILVALARCGRSLTVPRFRPMLVRGTLVWVGLSAGTMATTASVPRVARPDVAVMTCSPLRCDLRGQRAYANLSSASNKNIPFQHRSSLLRGVKMGGDSSAARFRDAQSADALSLSVPSTSRLRRIGDFS